jgi:hypothetical protein
VSLSHLFHSLGSVASVPGVIPDRVGTLANPYPQEKERAPRLPRDTRIPCLLCPLPAKPERPISHAPCDASLPNVPYSCQVRAQAGRMRRTTLLVTFAFLAGLGIGYYACWLGRPSQTGPTYRGLGGHRKTPQSGRCGHTDARSRLTEWNRGAE